MKEKLTCQNCGAPLTPDGKCEYCGTHYKIEKQESNVMYIETFHAPVETYKAVCAVGCDTLHILGAEKSAELIQNTLAKKLAEIIKGRMNISSYDDFRNDSKIFRGTIRIVTPDYRF